MSSTITLNFQITYISYHSSFAQSYPNREVPESVAYLLVNVILDVVLLFNGLPFHFFFLPYSIKVYLVSVSLN
jgi:hypothetical protein